MITTLELTYTDTPDLHRYTTAAVLSTFIKLKFEIYNPVAFMVIIQTQWFRSIKL